MRQAKMSPSAAGLFLHAGGAPPGSDQELFEQALAFANQPEGSKFPAWDLPDAQHPYMEEWRARGGTTASERMPSFVGLAAERRAQLRQELAGYLKDRPASRKRFVGQHARYLKEVVIKPTWRVSDSDTAVLRSDEFWVFSWPEMLAYLMLVLHDPYSGIPELCRCQLDSCQKFFLARKTGGRPQRLYHSRECLDKAHVLATRRAEARRGK